MDERAMETPVEPTEVPLEMQAYVQTGFINLEAYEQSAHGTQRCDACHSGITSLPHQLGLKADCQQCHGAIVEEFEASAHRGLASQGESLASACEHCHGYIHYTLVKENADSQAYPLNLARTCEKCHREPAAAYAGSIHGQLLAQGNPDVPMCTSCHTNHPIAPVETEGFKLGIVKECGGCHEEHYESFERSYHGKVTSLGGTTTARCSDCHHYHDILPKSDPHSSIASGNLITTCQRCHPKANKNFAEYVSHIDYRDRTNYPVVFYTWLFMTALLVGTLVFFTIHSILWFIRSLFDKELRHHVATSQGRHIMRFRLFHRMTHGLIIVSFLGLVATGFPLKYSYTKWAQELMAFLGGYQVAGNLHRFFAILTLVYVVMHVGYIVYYIRVKRRQPLLKFLFGSESMVLRLKDIKDFWMHVKWFFWLGPKPRWDRWTYWEKFDYWGVFWCVTIIGLSGLMLWFPTIFSVFLPGWMFNVATVIHSIEALLAAGVIFTVHFFNAHFRPGKFPMDPVIFTGRITKEEFKEERPEEYQRLVDQGRVEEHLTDAAPRWLEVFARVVGFTALLIGLFLIVAALATEFHNIFG